MRNRLLRGLSFWLTLCCLSVCVTVSPAARAEADGVRTDRALLIGVDDFVSRPSTYPSSTNNVFAMQEALQESETPFASIMIPDLPVTDASGLTTLICSTFAEADADDVSYLYISTHGEYDPDQGVEAALLLSDGVTQGSITPEELQAAFSGIAGTKVILLDACYSGAFIGKGMYRQPDKLYFQSDDFKVLTSSGAMEESWYWNDSDNTATGDTQGAFYFTQTLSQCLSPRYGALADSNRDGHITLSELYNALLQNHAASTPQVYPQEDDFVVFSYDTAERSALDPSECSPIGEVTFSGSALSQTDNRLSLEFVALRPVRVAYQIVYRRNGRWRFDEAQLLYDDAERYTTYGDEEGAISPGHKLRELTLNLQSAQESGYVMVQVVSIEDGRLTVHAGKVIAVVPGDGDPKLSVENAQQFTAGGSEELAIFVGHACPCQLSVSILNEAGEIVRRLCYHQSTRPMKIVPEGSCFYWNGRDKSGALVPAGTYHVQAVCTLGEHTFTAEGEPFALRAVEN